jgi:hypothetical protein
MRKEMTGKLKRELPGSAVLLTFCWVSLLLLGCERTPAEADSPSSTTPISSHANATALADMNEENSHTDSTADKSVDASAANTPPTVGIEVADIEEVRKYAMNQSNSRWRMSYDKRLRELARECGVRVFEPDEVHTKGIASLTELVNKAFNPERMLSSNDLAGVRALDPGQVFDVLDAARGWDVDLDRIYILLLTGLEDRVPEQLQAKYAYELGYVAKGVLGSKGGAYYHEMALELARQFPDDPEMLDIELTCLNILSDKPGASQRSVERDQAAERILAWADKHADTTWAPKLRGRALIAKVHSLAEQGRREEAFAVIDKAKNSDIAEYYREAFESSSWLEEIEQTCRTASAGSDDE